MSVLQSMYRAQGGRCFYCGEETWLPTEGGTKAMLRFGIIPGTPGARKAVRRRMATREHLVRKADGGKDAYTNLVMACRWCNQTRGERDVDAHRLAMTADMVRRAKAAGGGGFASGREKWNAVT